MVLKAPLCPCYLPLGAQRQQPGASLTPASPPHGAERVGEAGAYKGLLEVIGAVLLQGLWVIHREAVFGSPTAGSVS